VTDNRVAVVIPAKDEQRRIAATVSAASALPHVDLVVVVDDGSVDRTSASASSAGATVVRHSRNRGKAAAMETGAAAVQLIETREGVPARAMLFLDADLEDSAAKAAPLIEPVLTGEADMTIATLPAQRTDGGGRGFVVKLARNGIEQATGWSPVQPLSGQRCITRAAFEAALPLAPGFGVEVGLTIDLLRQGYRIREVEVPLHHRVTGTDWHSQVHRGRQWLHVLRALAVRGVRPRFGGRGPQR
jgi:glycosyltransferase involved in cell wall biosynthesis